MQAIENTGDVYGSLNQSVGSQRIAEADSEEAVSDADSQSDSVLGSGVSPQAAEDAAPQQPAPASPKRKLTVNGIRFGVDSEQINMDDPATRTNMNEMLEYLRESCQELRVLIGGHASSDGPEPRNQELSVLRARQVAAWLVEQGVPEEKIQGAIGYGSSMPKIAEPTPAIASRMTKEQLEAIREQNRRIELEILEDCK
jgi:outer membrane protein OmpA-like peptidoglycan-associated protein